LSPLLSSSLNWPEAKVLLTFAINSFVDQTLVERKKSGITSLKESEMDISGRGKKRGVLVILNKHQQEPMTSRESSLHDSLFRGQSCCNFYFISSHKNPFFSPYSLINLSSLPSNGFLHRDMLQFFSTILARPFIFLLSSMCFGPSFSKSDPFNDFPLAVLWSSMSYWNTLSKSEHFCSVHLWLCVESKTIIHLWSKRRDTRRTNGHEQSSQTTKKCWMYHTISCIIHVIWVSALFSHEWP
jgi:hypothetical protein